MKVRPWSSICSRAPKAFRRQMSSGQHKKTCEPVPGTLPSQGRVFCCPAEGCQSTRSIGTVGLSTHLQRNQITFFAWTGLVIYSHLAIAPFAGEVVGTDEHDRAVICRAQFEL